MKFGILIMALLISTSAGAVVTKDCPESISAVFADPKVPASLQYAADLFFQDNGAVGGELKLVDTSNSECRYRKVREENDIHSVVLKGSRREGAKEPATLVAYMNLGLDGLRQLIVYMGINKIETSGVEVKGIARLYKSEEYCHYGCAPFHTRIGEFQDYLVE